ncbi:hypothetical protein K431DRAFT_287548 [Polychaeton citri CBS 116435]|uniref:Integral membrane protein n=1 Tax=Polychaeton citri CBS 116435 TaxID=1314669 RepID=A0A9P4Q369_9PEZI|nr:hypothetical protein K431DRAFT_287548 [Polychaeton citri CBS 116435]
MDYFSYGNSGRRSRASSAAQERLNAPSTPGGQDRVRPAASRESLRPPRAQSNIRIRRLPSNQAIPPQTSASHEGVSSFDHADRENEGRRRSTSEPQRPNPQQLPGPNIQRQRTYEGPSMGTLAEEGQSIKSPPLQSPPMHPGFGNNPPGLPTPDGTSRPQPQRGESGVQAMQGAANAVRSNRGMGRMRSGTLPSRYQQDRANEYDSDIVDLLDLIDPEVSTLGTLTNVQNSLFVPDLGRWVNRRPTYELTSRPTTAESASGSFAPPRPRSRATTRAQAEARQAGQGLGTIQQGQQSNFDDVELDDQETLSRRASITSNISETHYAVLPHGVHLEGWTEEDKVELNDHVRHLLHSRREGFKRGWRGFKQYVSKPLGLFVTVYAVLVTVFGMVWVFLLIGWIYAGNRRQDYIVDIIDNILVALFALIGDGMAPFRVVDTYHMCFIANYHHKTWTRREKRGLPELRDHNDLPKKSLADLERGAVNAGINAELNKADLEDRLELSVLSPEQQARLQYHQDKFSKSHTFYKPHETPTHHAFPLRLLVAIVVLLDCHSLFQVALGSCTWSIPYETRPQSLTATILSCSITCNIVAGVLISIGDKRTRKKDVLERLFRQELTTEAIRKIQKRRVDETGAGGLQTPEGLTEAEIKDQETAAREYGAGALVKDALDEDQLGAKLGVDSEEREGTHAASSSKV